MRGRRAAFVMCLLSAIALLADVERLLESLVASGDQLSIWSMDGESATEIA
jgi:hypothetical protein